MIFPNMTEDRIKLFTLPAKYVSGANRIEEDFIKIRTIHSKAAWLPDELKEKLREKYHWELTMFDYEY